jgi:hypothetical protein
VFLGEQIGRVRPQPRLSLFDGKWVPLPAKKMEKVYRIGACVVADDGEGDGDDYESCSVLFFLA